MSKNKNKYSVTDEDFKPKAVDVGIIQAIANDNPIKKEAGQDFIKDVYTAFGVGRFGPNGAWANFRLDIDFKTSTIINLEISPPTLRANANSSLKADAQRYLEHEQE